MKSIKKYPCVVHFPDKIYHYVINRNAYNMVYNLPQKWYYVDYDLLRDSESIVVEIPLKYDNLRNRFYDWSYFFTDKEFLKKLITINNIINS